MSDSQAPVFGITESDVESIITGWGVKLEELTQEQRTKFMTYAGDAVANQWWELASNGVQQAIFEENVKIHPLCTYCSEVIVETEDTECEVCTSNSEI